jgi:hypothetical protein
LVSNPGPKCKKEACFFQYKAIKDEDTAIAKQNEEKQHKRSRENITHLDAFTSSSCNL